jgi:hypothetical protein
MDAIPGGGYHTPCPKMAMGSSGSWTLAMTCAAARVALADTHRHRRPFRAVSRSTSAGRHLGA